MAEVADLVDARALAWHRAATLLRANKINRRSGEEWSAPAHALLAEAARFAKAAG